MILSGFFCCLVFCTNIPLTVFPFLLYFRYQRPMVPPLHISMPLVITSSSHHVHYHRRSLHLAPTNPLHLLSATPPPLTVTGKHCSPVPHLTFNNSSPSSPIHKPLSLSHSHPLTAPPIGFNSPSNPNKGLSHFAFDFTYSSPVPEETLAPASPPVANARSSTSPMKVTGPSNDRRLSDSDLSTPPKGIYNMFQTKEL